MTLARNALSMYPVQDALLDYSTYRDFENCMSALNVPLSSMFGKRRFHHEIETLLQAVDMLVTLNFMNHSFSFVLAEVYFADERVRSLYDLNEMPIAEIESKKIRIVFNVLRSDANEREEGLCDRNNNDTAETTEANNGTKERSDEETIARQQPEKVRKFLHHLHTLSSKLVEALNEPEIVVIETTREFAAINTADETCWPKTELTMRPKRNDTILKKLYKNEWSENVTSILNENGIDPCNYEEEEWIVMLFVETDGKEYPDASLLSDKELRRKKRARRSDPEAERNEELRLRANVPCAPISLTYRSMGVCWSDDTPKPLLRFLEEHRKIQRYRCHRTEKRLFFKCYLFYTAHEASSSTKECGCVKSSVFDCDDCRVSTVFEYAGAFVIYDRLKRDNELPDRHLLGHLRCNIMNIFCPIHLLKLWKYLHVPTNRTSNDTERRAFELETILFGDRDDDDDANDQREHAAAERRLFVV